MAVTMQFIDNCSHYGFADVAQKYNSGSVASQEVGRLGIGLALVNPTALRKTVLTGDTIVCGGAFKVTSAPASTMTIIRIENSGEDIAQVRVNTSMQLEVTIDGSVVATVVDPTKAIQTGQYYDIEFAVELAPVNGFFELRVTGANVASAGPINTSAGAAGNALNTFGFNASGLVVDSCYCKTGSGGYLTSDFQGATRKLTMYPTGDGHYSSGTFWQKSGGVPQASFTLVDDPQANGDGDYIFHTAYANGETDKEGWLMGQLPADFGIVHCVQMVAQLRTQTSGATVDIDLIRRSVAGSEYSLLSAVASALTSYKFVLGTPQELDPESSLQWTAASLIADTWGVELKALS